MQDREYAARVDAVRQRAHGRWSELLAAAGVHEQILKHRNGPCPLCGGTDRFQYTDKFGEGNYHCRHCGPGGGFKLLQAVKGIDFPTALRDIEQCLGGLPATPASASPDRAPQADRMRRLVRRTWDQAVPVTEGDEVDRYLRGRGLVLASYPTTLRRHPALGYYERTESGKSRKVGEHPAMLALIQAPDGEAIALHRTYLADAAKLPVRDAKKVLSSGIAGAAVRLHPAGEQLAVCECVETALAVHLATGLPVWSALNAGNLERIWLPESVREVGIYADNDADRQFTGQWHAYALAHRLMRDGAKAGVPAVRLKVRVHVPRQPGTDWADVWRQRHGDAAGTAA